MFVNRSGLKSSTEKTVSPVSGADHHAAQRRAAVIGLAVAATVSVVSVTWSRLHAEENLDNPIRPLSLQAEGAASDADLLKQALGQYRKDQFEDAKSILGQINAANLSEGEQKRLAELNGDVEAALAGRQAARAQFAEGQAALEAGNQQAARKLFKDAGDNKFADDATKQKAREQLGVVAELEKQRAAELKTDYQQAKKDFEAGNFADAKARFEKLAQAGFKAPMFQSSPSDYLKKIEQKTAAVAEAGEKPAEAAVAETPAAEAPSADEQAKADRKAAEQAAREERRAAQQKAREEREAAEVAAKEQQQKAKAAYKAGVQALQAGDYAVAREQFKAADETGYKTAMFEASAVRMLAEVDKREAESKAAAERQATEGQEQPAEAKAETKTAEQQAEADRKAAEQAAKAERDAAKAQAKAEEQAAEEAARAQRTKAKEAYQAGLAALKANDFAAARTNFKAAEEAGYKPGLFEASATKMLAEVDQREAKAAQAGEAKPQEPVAQAPTGETPAVQAPVQPEQPAAVDEKAAEAQAKAEKEAAEAQAKLEKEAAETQAKAEKEAARAQAKAERESAATRQVAAREQYKAGLAALNSGDFAAARQAFKAADEQGFKPGLFEASAAKMLTQVDEREAKGKTQGDQVAAREAAEADRERARSERQAAEAKAKADREAARAQARAQRGDVEVETSPEAKAELEATAKMEQIRQQARSYDSQRLVEQAQAAQAEGRSASALELYTRAADIDPSNQAAVDGRNQMLTLQGRAPVTSSLLDEQIRTNRARKEAITYAFNDAIDRARANIAADDYQNAQMQLEAAVVARQQDPNLFTQDEVRELDTTLAETQLQLRQSREAFERAERQRLADEATEREQTRLRQIEAERRATVAALIADSRRYISRNQYREALATIDQIIALDPTNEYATGVRPLVEDRALLQEQRTFREEFRTQYVRTMNATEEARIPYGDYFRYPDNWADISQSRDRFVEEEKGFKQADRAVRAALDKRLPEVRIDGQPFDDVIQFLRDMTGANIFVRWQSLEQAAIDRKTPVSVQLRDVKFSKVLQTVLDSVSPDPNTRLAYTVNEGVITIYVTQDLTLAGTGGVDLVTHVYDITDLMYQIPDLAPGDSGGGGGGGNNTGGGLSGGGGRSTGGGGSGRSSGGGGSSRSGGGGGSSRGGGGGGGGLFGGDSGGGRGGSGSSGSGGTGGNQLSTYELMDEMTYLISETVAVDTWEENGGTGSIRPSPVNQQLIITQTPEVHAQIEALLAQVRESQAIQVTVEARFLTVSRNFLEDVGMDFDFSWNFNNPDKFSPISVTQDSTSFTANPNTGIPGSIASASSGIAPGATLSGTYLDDFQVSFLIRATQAHVAQSVVTAPRVTVYNGGSAIVWVYTYQPYVSQLEPEVASGVVGYSQEIEEAEDGVTLFVRANVSADRKYVTLYLLPELNRLLGLQTFSFQQASTLPSNVIGGDTVVTQQPTLTIQQPIIQEIGVETLVSVPDGGTLLLGGQTVAGEIEREAGVPVLSKLPIIKRFFTNKSMAKDESVLLILVKPTIIIQKEQEARQFPLLSSKISGE